MASTKPLAIIAGVGPGTGASVARRFGKAYNIAVLARTSDSYNGIVSEINDAGGKAVGYNVDVSDEKSVNTAFSRINQELGSAGLAAAVYNVGGKFIRKPFLEMTGEEFASGYEANGIGAFNFSKAALPLLLKSTSLQYAPTLIFTGATASTKGSASMSSFATGKFAMRALSQSLAREFGPQGVHVSHAIIDGVIDIPRTKGWAIGDGKPDAKISADAIAETYWNLHTQHRSCFTWEIDIRPYVEKW
ncbi:MAG: hypothetical protein M4579_006130 [Chaenotheca gracillima]|nr:MAG: hypothetical protein M4579_006130 [Chaenotheca gracillima]